MNLVVNADMVARYPRLTSRAVRAIASIRADERLMACRHVLNGDRVVVMLCAQHPSAGLLCVGAGHRGCAVQHTRRHPSELEQRCDECEAVVDIITGCTVIWPFADGGVEVRDTSGRRRHVHAVMVMSLGFCLDCRGEESKAMTA